MGDLKSRRTDRHTIDTARPGGGIRIEPQDIERTFVPFEQFEGTIRRKIQSTGPGFPLASKMIELYFDRIKVRSEEADRGAIFEVILPIVERVNEGNE